MMEEIMTERDEAQSGRSEPEAFNLSAFTPNDPSYQPSYRLEEQLRNDDRGDAQAELQGSGTFVDNGWDRWHFMVVPGTLGPNVLTLQLQVADIITWWKRIEVASNLFGSWFSIRTIGTVNDNRTAAVDLTIADAQSGTIRLEFWKAGFLGSGSYVTTQVLDVPSHLGKRVVFLCTRDHPSQP
jgi:hypothetical protein